LEKQFSRVDVRGGVQVLDKVGWCIGIWPMYVMFPPLGWM